MIINENNKQAKVFLDEVTLETEMQIRSMLKEECVENAAVMPDCHKGNGCCVGFTFPLSTKIVPNYIGGDIGCGIVTHRLGMFKHERKLEKFERIIRDRIPMGNGHTNVHSECVAYQDELDMLFGLSNSRCADFCKMYDERFKTSSTNPPAYNMEWFNDLCSRVRINCNYALRELGTLGGGNHFVEVNIDEMTSEKYLTIHSGSRSLGSKICAFHQSKITTGFDWDKFNNEMQVFKGNKLGKKEYKVAREAMTLKVKTEAHPPYLCGSEALEYYYDMIFAQVFAEMNRRIMLRRTIESMNLECSFEESSILESIHNVIDFRDFIVRKGAISAHLDELCIVSLNMKEGILLCKGKGNSEWNYSGPHGLGRDMTRTEAKRSLQLKHFQKEMQHVFSTSVCKDTLDESPMAYKNCETVVNQIAPTLQILNQLKPVINVKSK